MRQPVIAGIALTGGAVLWATPPAVFRKATGTVPV
jgi:hypothetical protein